MKERPIIFSAGMVRAILDGRKTQTRRVVKPQPERTEQRVERIGYAVAGPVDVTVPDGWRWRTLYTADPPHNPAGLFASSLATHCPYGAPGDRLWVRETWQAVRSHSDGEIDTVYPIPKEMGSWGVVYAATDPQADDGRDDRGFAWRPGIHMPRWASRIDLEITEVRVERLHDISEEDARAEGIDTSVVDPSPRGCPGGVRPKQYAHARDCFADLWREINGAESWDASPWVWVVSFRRVRP